jgi:hypothetical protein
MDKTNSKIKTHLMIFAQMLKKIHDQQPQQLPKEEWEKGQEQQEFSSIHVQVQ